MHNQKVDRENARRVCEVYAHGGSPLTFLDMKNEDKDDNAKAFARDIVGEGYCPANEWTQRMGEKPPAEL